MRAIIILALLARAAHADVHHEAVFGSHIRALHTSSANALTDDSLAGPVFGYAYRIPLQIVPKLELWGTANMLLGFGDGEMFQTLSTNIDAFQLSGGLRARYLFWRGLVAASARVDLGAQRIAVTLADLEDHTASDTGWGATSTAALGVEVNPLALRALSVGLRAELGYVANQAIGLTAKSKGAPEGTIELDRMAASLGHLDLGGRYFSFTVTTRF